MNQQLQNIAYSVIILIGAGWILHVGASLILPLCFAVLFATFLYPIEKRIFAKVSNKWLSIPLTFLVVLLPVLLVATLFSLQFMSILDSLPAIGANLRSGLDRAFDQVQEMLPFAKLDSDKLLSDNISSVLDAPISILGKGLVSSSSILVGSLITFIYTIFILYYRRSFRNFVVYQFEKQDRPDIIETIQRIRVTVQAYVGGLGLVILLLSVMNSLGLWIIGIQHPIFWGALGGLLAIIPYVGTGLGGLLPFLYALATADHNWQPVAVLIFYGIVQTLEGNVITPKIVGDKVDINPLVAIIALVFFAELWGIGGVILALPLISIIRIVLTQFESTRPIAILMGSTVADDAHKFRELADS